MAYIAQYSPRPNTAAEKLKDNVSKIEKKQREKILTDILKTTALEKNKKMVNKTIQVLVENKQKNYYIGKTKNFKNVKIKTNKKDLIGKIVDAEIIKATEWNLEGK